MRKSRSFYALKGSPVFAILSRLGVISYCARDIAALSPYAWSPAQPAPFYVVLSEGGGGGGTAWAHALGKSSRLNMVTVGEGAAIGLDHLSSALLLQTS